MIVLKTGPQLLYGIWQSLCVQNFVANSTQNQKLRRFLISRAAPALILLRNGQYMLLLIQCVCVPNFAAFEKCRIFGLEAQIAWTAITVTNSK